MKKLLSLVLASVLCLALAVPALSADLSGKCGENLTWAYDPLTGTFTVSGTGDMYNYGYVDDHSWNIPPWQDYRENIKKLVFEEGITSIGNYAFDGCSIQILEIPYGVTRIGDSALFSSELVKVIIPTSVIEIGWMGITGSDATEVYYLGSKEQWDKIKQPFDLYRSAGVGGTIHYTITSNQSGTCGEIAKAYQDALTSATLYRYAKGAIAFWDLNGDTLPEMLLWTENQSNPSLTEIQVWSCHNGVVRSVGSISWGMASSSHSLYISNSGQLVDFGNTSSDSCVWINRDVYSYSLSPGFEQIEKVEFTHEYDMNLHAFGRLTCKVNGAVVSDQEAETRKDALGTDIYAVIFGESSSGQTLGMSKNEAIARLNIDDFFDVRGDQYFADPVKWAVENGITNGTGDYTFSPEITCTRAHILTFLWRAVGSPTVEITNPFSDISVNNYYYQAALWAYQNGMVNGSVFAPTTPCTRAATVTYIWQSKGSPSAGIASFSDVSASAAYSQAVAWAVSNGITDGVGNNQFAPDMICSRGQIVTFLYRARNVSSGSEVNVSVANQAMAAYKDFVSQKHHDDEWSYDIERFGLLDMNADGIPELLTIGGGRMDYLKIFTYNNGSVQYVHWGSNFQVYDNGVVYVEFGGGDYRLYSYYSLDENVIFGLVFRYAEWWSLEGIYYTIGENAYDENSVQVPYQQIVAQRDAILGNAQIMSILYHENTASERLAVFGE